MKTLVPLAFIASASIASAQTPILEYGFDDPNYIFDDGNGNTRAGSGAVSTGSDTRAVGFQNAFGGFPRNGSFLVENGVSGQSGDYAFQVNTDLMGGHSSGGGGAQSMARTDGSFSALDNLTSFTVSGWFQTSDSTQFGNFARLLDYRQDSTNTGFRIRNNGTNGVLQFTVGTGSLTASGFSATEEWVFFAATYDAATDAANIYIGGTSSAVSLANGGTIVQAESTTGVVSDNLAIGNTSGSGRPFHGFLDNIAVYGSTVDGSGVLSLAQLESVRAGAVVPEPSAYAFLAGLGALCLIAVRRRR